jgi:acyl-coenzyme A thioesterase PaaI-like protein
VSDPDTLFLGDEPLTSDSRLALAATLRELGHALVAHQADDEVLDHIHEKIKDLIPKLADAPARPHALAERGPALFDRPPEDGIESAPKDGFPDCIISGQANPMGVAARLWREGDEGVLQTTLGPAFEGAPGRAHGGIVASLIDEAMGIALSVTATPAFTGRLGVTYRGPTPIGEPLEVRARVTEIRGRKITITAELRTPDRLLAEAEALFIAVDPERFFEADHSSGNG